MNCASAYHKHIPDGIALQEEMIKMLIETGESSCLDSIVLKYLHEKDTW
jgi:hypothetical protein